MRRRKNSGKILRGTIFAICLLFPGCQDSAKNRLVDFVDRSAMLSLDKKPNPLMLVVEIDEDGKLSLNKIETGTISDVSLLSDKLKVIFDDREKASIKERKVVIDSKSKVKSEDLEKLVETLASVKASPIRIVKNDF